MRKKAISAMGTGIGIVIMVVVLILIIMWFVPSTGLAKEIMDVLSPSDIAGTDKAQELADKLESGIDYCCNINKQMPLGETRDCGHFAIFGEFSKDRITPPSICSLEINPGLEFKKDKETCTKAILSKTNEQLVVTLYKAESSSKCR